MNDDRHQIIVTSGWEEPLGSPGVLETVYNWI